MPRALEDMLTEWEFTFARGLQHNTDVAAFKELLAAIRAHDPGPGFGDPLTRAVVGAAIGLRTAAIAGG
jgi:hypothetical protein